MNDLRSSANRDSARRIAILKAAKACFVRYGYAKTSFESIAQTAGVSRPLIYRRFKNKEEILVALFESIFTPRYVLAESITKKKGGKKKRLLELYEILLVEPWNELMGEPSARELYLACTQIVPGIVSKHERILLQLTQSIVGPKDLSQLFILCVTGLQTDFPSTLVLKRRLRLLIESLTLD